jgi:hypothetical protein
LLLRHRTKTVKDSLKCRTLPASGKLCATAAKESIRGAKSSMNSAYAGGNGISLWMIGDSDDKSYQCSIEGDPPSHLSTEQAFHGSVTENGVLTKFNAPN